MSKLLHVKCNCPSINVKTDTNNRSNIYDRFLNNVFVLLYEHIFVYIVVFQIILNIHRIVVNHFNIV